MNVSEDLVEQVIDQTGAEAAPALHPPGEEIIATVPMATQRAAVDVAPGAPEGVVHDKVSIPPEGVVANVSDVTAVPGGTAVGSASLSMRQEVVVPGTTFLEGAVVSTVPNKMIDDSVAQESGLDRHGDPQGSPPKSYAEAVASSTAKADDVAGDDSFDSSDDSESEYDEVFAEVEADPVGFKHPLSASSGSSEDSTAPSTKRGKAFLEAANVPLPEEDSDPDVLDLPLVVSEDLDCNIDTSSDITDSPLSQFTPNLARDRGYTQSSSGPSQLAWIGGYTFGHSRVLTSLYSFSWRFLHNLPLSFTTLSLRPVSGTFGKK